MIELRQNLALEIAAVGNGFLVRPAGDILSALDQETRVFQSFAELVAFLDVHFTHRCEKFLHDTISTGVSPDETDPVRDRDSGAAGAAS